MTLAPGGYGRSGAELDGATLVVDPCWPEIGVLEGAVVAGTEPSGYPEEDPTGVVVIALEDDPAGEL